MGRSVHSLTFSRFGMAGSVQCMQVAMIRTTTRQTSNDTISLANSCRLIKRSDPLENLAVQRHRFQSEGLLKPRIRIHEACHARLGGKETIGSPSLGLRRHVRQAHPGASDPAPERLGSRVILELATTEPLGLGGTGHSCGP